MRKYLILTFLLLIVAWVISIKYPYYLFSEKYTYQNFSVYHNDKKIDINQVKLILDEVNEKIKKSIYYKKINIRILVCNNKLLYTVFSPTNLDGLATNYVHENNIFLAQINFSNNLSKSLFNDYEEKLDILLAHEITHSFLNYFGFTKSSKWIKEGYCEYIAYDKKNNIRKDFLKFKKTRDIYIKYRLCISFLMREKYLSLKEIIDSKIKLKDIFEELEKKYSS